MEYIKNTVIAAIAVAAALFIRHADAVRQNDALAASAVYGTEKCAAVGITLEDAAQQIFDGWESRK